MAFKTVSEARGKFAEVVDAAQHHGERTIIRRRNKVAAAVVSPADLALLEQLEEAMDRRAVQAARRDIKKHGTVTLDEILNDLEG